MSQDRDSVLTYAERKTWAEHRGARCQESSLSNLTDVEAEYYVYDSDDNELVGWRREAGQWQRVDEVNGWTSPLLGVRFELTTETLVMYHPDGSRFETFAELERQQRQRDTASGA